MPGIGNPLLKPGAGLLRRRYGLRWSAGRCTRRRWWKHRTLRRWVWRRDAL